MNSIPNFSKDVPNSSDSKLLGEHLCSRQKRVDVYLLPPGKQLRVLAQMQDHVHNIHIDMTVDHLDLTILSLSCSMPSVPDPECVRARKSYNFLVGERIQSGLIRKIQERETRACTHMTNLFHDVFYNLTLAQGTALRKKLVNLSPNITDSQIVKVFLMFRPKLRNSCIRYADTRAFMTALDKISLPKKVMEFLSSFTKKQGGQDS